MSGGAKIAPDKAHAVSLDNRILLANNGKEKDMSEMEILIMRVRQLVMDGAWVLAVVALLAVRAA